MLIPGGFGFPLGFLAAILTTTVAVAAGATTHPVLALIPLLAVTLTIAAASTPAAAVATAAVSWTLQAGFVRGRHGDLALTPQSMRDAAILGTVTLLAALTTTLVRTSHSRLVAVPPPRADCPSATSAGPQPRWPAHR